LNKGVAIGIAVGLIAVIGGAYAFFGIQDRPLEDSGSIGITDEADVETTSPDETQQEAPGQTGELGIKDVAEIEVAGPEEEESIPPQTVEAEETIGFEENP